MKAPDKCYYVCRYETEDGTIDKVRGYDSDVSADKFFTDVSEVECFSDCNPVGVVEIVWHNNRVSYMGWKPGMLYQFGDIEKHIVWEGRFPEWDH